VIALLGGCCAALIALWSLDTIRAISPANVSRFQETNIDPMVLLFGTGIIIVSAFLVGIWPALRIPNNASMANDLHDSGARSSDSAQRQRARSILVVAQVALAVVLLAGAALTLKSFWRVQQVPLGFDPRGVLTMTIALPPSHYESPEKISRFYDQLVEEVRALPGVSAATICNNAPFDHDEWDSSFHVTGAPPDPPGQEPISEMSIVSPDFFRVLGMPILHGRPFSAQDTTGRPGSVIIDELAAKKFFPGVDPIGKQIDDPVTIGLPVQNGAPLTIVGIVPHTRNNAPGERDDARNLPMMYFSAAQFPKNKEGLIVRAQPGGNPHSLVSPIKEQIVSLDPDQAVAEVATMQENISESLVFAAPNDDAAWGFCRPGTLPCKYWFVWRDGVKRHPAHARTRNSHGAWRGALGSFPFGPESRHDPGFARDWPGIDWCNRGKPRLKQFALRRGCARCSRFCRRNCLARSCLSARVLVARSPRHTR